jgi:hypothetical protein
LQSSILVGWVAELGSLESHALKQDCQMANAVLERNPTPRYLFAALKKSMIALFFLGHSGCVPVPSQ